MARVWSIFFVYGLVITFGQYIYENDEDECNSDERNSGTIATLLTEVRKIQREVDKLRRENIEIRDFLKCFKRNTDCEDEYESGRKKSGVYRIEPFCNDIQIIQKRMNVSVDFNRTWADYKRGFGNPHDSYWIGNEVIYQLTNGRNSSLYVSITLQNGTTLYELYQQFSVSGERDNYRLYLGGPATGTLGYSMFNTGSPNNDDLSGMNFSTLNRDNDMCNCNCAVRWGGGWWHNSCYNAFQNGPWFSSINIWRPTVPDGREIKETVMMIKPN